MAVPYETAVATIQGMFSGSVDKEVICAVLEANNGHMEKTIECLLAMSGELPAEEEVPTTSNSQTSDQIRDDEMYAKMLQNQMFMQQIRSVPEFSGLFGMAPGQLRQSNTAVELTLCQDRSQEPDFQIGEKFKQMGEAAKLKFRELALKFKKNDKPDVKYAPVSTNPDDAEVVTFDNSLAKRTATSFEDTEPNDENEIPLATKKSLSSSQDSKPLTATSRKHTKDD